MSYTTPPVPPKAPIHPKTTITHDDTRIDNYYWLSERDNPEVVAYLEAENAYTDAMMAHTADLQETIYQELRARMKEDDPSVPVRHGNYFYYDRTLEGAQYPLYCRKRGSLEAVEEILLDLNELAAAHEYLHLQSYSVSPDHRLLLYSIDTTGGESYTLYIKNLETGKLLPETIRNTGHATAWANDNQTILYTRHDEALRPNRLMRHRLGNNPDNDVIVYQEDDRLFNLGVYKTKSSVYIILHMASKMTTEQWYIPADAPESNPMVIHPREAGLEYKVEHHHSETHGERFIIITNDDAYDFRVMEAPVMTSGKDHWRELLAQRNNGTIVEMQVFRNYLVLYGREGGFCQLWVMNLISGEVHPIEFPEPIYYVRPPTATDNPEFESEIVRLTYTSPITPSSVYDYHMNNRTRELKKRAEVLGDFDPNDYVAERLYATASDGTQVPISLTRHRDTPRDQPAPLHLWAYGAYGANNDPTFPMLFLGLLDRGVVFANAHVRGGGEMGRAWYDNGKLMHKKNTFTDFIACTEHLIAEGYTTPKQLVAEGHSAGGLLMGVIANTRPELYAGIVTWVPFVDIINTLLDTSLPLTVPEWEEWGNPNDPVQYDYLKSYSPYDNVEAQDYPQMFVKGGFNDPYVQYWEPAKWVARLRSLKTDNNRLILKTNMDTGHDGASGRFDFLREAAFNLAFILDVFGIRE
ncbi:MAG: S9 family peptidase [Chloroflexota bacterium]